MKLSRDDVVTLRKSGDLTGKEALSLVRQVVKACDDHQNTDRQSEALERLVTVIEGIGKQESVEVETESIQPVLVEIKEELQKLTTATMALAKTREKKWEFTPEYSQSGRLLKITAK